MYLFDLVSKVLLVILNFVVIPNTYIFGNF